MLEKSTKLIGLCVFQPPTKMKFYTST